jgi:hypothetical protein
MTASEDHRDHNAKGLKESLRVAWSNVANPSLTPFERREARHQIKQYGAELRRYLQIIEAERSRSRKHPSAESAGHGFEQPKFRILA